MGWAGFTKQEGYINNLKHRVRSPTFMWYGAMPTPKFACEHAHKCRRFSSSKGYIGLCFDDSAYIPAWERLVSSIDVQVENIECFKDDATFVKQHSVDFFRDCE